MKKWNSQKGIGGTDAIIAVAIIAIFAGLVATIGYNIYVANSSLKRMAKASAYITDIFEYVDKTYYDDVTAESLVNYTNNFSDSKVGAKIITEDITYVIPEKYTNASYKIDVTVTNYNYGDETKLDLVKTINLKIKYNLQGKEQVIEMNKIKKRENLITPNIPNLDLISKGSADNHIYPVKYINDTWQITNENDSTWYNYNNGYWAVVIETSNTYTEGDIIQNIQSQTIWLWIPRYAYNNVDNSDIKFLYNTSDKYVENNSGYNTLTEIDNNYTIKPQEIQAGYWEEDENISSEQLNSSIKYQIRNLITT